MSWYSDKDEAGPSNWPYSCVGIADPARWLTPPSTWTDRAAANYTPPPPAVVCECGRIFGHRDGACCPICQVPRPASDSAPLL